MGIARRAIEQGKVFEAINYVVNGKVTARVPLGHFGKGLTQFPYLLILEQSKTEPLLIDLLATKGYSVEWETELTSLTQIDAGVSAVLKRNGKEETAQADWLIGADGGRSPVRTMLSIPFGEKLTKNHCLYLIAKSIGRSKTMKRLSLSQMTASVSFSR